MRIQNFGGTVTGDQGARIGAHFNLDWRQRRGPFNGDVSDIGLCLNPLDAPDWIVTGGLTVQGNTAYPVTTQRNVEEL